MDHDTDDASIAVPTDNDTTVVPDANAAEETSAVEVPTQAAPSINLAWSQSEDETILLRPWRSALGRAGLVVLCGIVVAVAVCAIGWWVFGASPRGPAPQRATSAPPSTPAVPTSPATNNLTAAPPAASSPPAAPTTQPAARMVGHNLQLQGTPEQWDAVTAELARQGIDVTISAVGVITELKFANYDRAPDNWVRWYAKHVPQDPNPIKEGGPISMLEAYEHGLPVPPPPAICYTNDGTPVATAAFDPAIYGSYADHCGPTPGALAGH